MKKSILLTLSILVLAFTLVTGASATTAHTVVRGDTVWKIAVRYQVGFREILDANPQLENPSLIYPGQTINVPTLDDSILAFEAEVVRLVNEIRAENGLGSLQADWQLARVARYKSQDMRDLRYFSHTSPLYGSPYQMMSDFGISYRTAGENIAKGYATPQAVVNAWMNSSGHRANILNGRYTRIGVGYEPEGNHWTQMFAG